jgi:hypothetical protein
MSYTENYNICHNLQTSFCIIVNKSQCLPLGEPDPVLSDLAHVEKTKYILLSRHRNVGENQHMKITNRSFENVSQFKYLGTTETNKKI